MLPLPGSPSSSWATFNARVRAAFEGADFRLGTAFWLFGLINNVLYVIVLSAALDLVGPNVPKSVVLLADVVPSFIAKLVAPYFIHVVPYSVRVVLFAALSTWGMVMIALAPSYTDGGTISIKLAGVILASLSSGAGELSFLALTHFYGPSGMALSAWGSGTGGAGIIGAGAYSLATTSLGLSVKTTLLASSFLPVIMLLGFFLILPRGPLRRTNKSSFQKHQEPDTIGTTLDQDNEAREDEGLLANPAEPHSTRDDLSWRENFVQNLRRSRGLFFPYMLPLLLVYMAEYTINQSVAPTLLFPLDETPFTEYRSFYPTYAMIYQIGVFVSRSSLPFLRLHRLYPPSFLQMLNLALLTLHALYPFLPSIYIVFAIIFWEGLLGGAVYVNTFAKVGEEADEHEREFALGAVTVSDSTGICIAGVVGVGIEEGLCRWQVERGRDWCRRL